MSDKGGWVTVGENSPKPKKAPQLPSSQSKNLRRRQSRRQKQKANQTTSASIQIAAAACKDTDPILHRALSLSLQTLNAPKEPPSPDKRIRKLKKKLNRIAELEARKEKGTRLNDAEITKVKSKESLKKELRILEEKKLVALAKAASKQKAMEMSGRVQFDIRFACPICREVLEAATMLLPCRHVFCRSCLEQALQYSVKDDASAEKQLALMVCPLCRTKLYDVKAKKVHTKPARSLRKKLAKNTGVCHCGATMTLSSLRQHLRECGSEECTSLYGIRPNFGHQRFSQPQLDLSSGATDRRLYNEEAALQEALVESLRLAGLS